MYPKLTVLFTSSVQLVINVHICQDFFPPNKQTNEHFEKHFKEHGLEKLISYQVTRMVVL